MTQYVSNPIFENPIKSQEIKNKIEFLEIPAPNTGWYFQLKRKSQKRKTEFVSKELEYQLFITMNWAKYKLSMMVTEPVFDTAENLKQEKQFYENIINKIESSIVSNNISLVMNIIKKRFNNYDYDDFLSEGNFALLNAVRQFDVSKGFRFSTYAYHSVKNAFVNLAREQSKKDINFEDEKDDGQKHFDIVDNREITVNFLEDLRNIIETNSAKLSDLEIKVIEMRYFHAEKMIYDDIGRRIGYSREWAKQKELSALQKIKEVLKVNR